jgi:hypothetical protein
MARTASSTRSSGGGTPTTRCRSAADRITVQGTGQCRHGQPFPTATTAPITYQHLPPPTNRETPAPVVEANERVATGGSPGGGDAGGGITFVRPDAAHTAYHSAHVAGHEAVQGDVRARAAGAGRQWSQPMGLDDPPDQRSTLMRRSTPASRWTRRGGRVLRGSGVRPLVNGAASIVIAGTHRERRPVGTRALQHVARHRVGAPNLELLVDNAGGPPLGVAPAA